MKFLNKFFKTIVFLAGKPQVINGTVGLGEYLLLILNRFLVAFSLIVLGVICGPIYFLIVRPYGWLEKKIAEKLNRIRIDVVPKDS